MLTRLMRKPSDGARLCFFLSLRARVCYYDPQWKWQRERWCVTRVSVLEQPAECIVAEYLDHVSVCIDWHARLVCQDPEVAQDSAMLITTVQSSSTRSSCGVVVVVLRSIGNWRKAGLLAVQWLAELKKLTF
jgi:hypothetical protein